MINAEVACGSHHEYIKFLKRFTLFIFTIFFIIAILMYITRTVCPSYHINQNITIIVCGDSHIQAGINDSILDNSTNIALASQQYIYTYIVLRTLLATNPHINSVILGYSCHNLSSYREEMDVLKEASQYSKYSLIIDNATSLLIFDYNIINICINMLQTVMTNIEYCFSEKYPYIGKYYNSYGNNVSIEGLEETLNRHYFSNTGTCYIISRRQIHYLLEIVVLCSDMGVDLYLLNMPVTTQYYEAIPEKYIQQYYAIANWLNVPLFDYHRYQLPDTCYGDVDHLNSYGAEIFTNFLNGCI